MWGRTPDDSCATEHLQGNRETVDVGGPKIPMYLLVAAQISSHPSIETGAMDISIDSGCGRAMDPAMAHAYSLGLEDTMAPGASADLSVLYVAMAA